MWINPETLELSDEPADNLERVLETQCPVTGRLEKAVPGTPELIDGMWHETWVLEPLAVAEVAQVVEAERVNASHEVVRYTSVLEAHYDSTAQAKRYDNRLTCALRAGYPGPYQKEALAFALWMDTCNVLAYKTLADVVAGLVNKPSAGELISSLPLMVWPTVEQS